MKLVAYQAQLGDLHGVTSHQYTFAVDDTYYLQFKDYLDVKDYLDDEGGVLRSMSRWDNETDWAEITELPTGLEEQIEMFWEKKNPLKNNLHLLKEMDIFINIIN